MKTAGWADGRLRHEVPRHRAESPQRNPCYLSNPCSNGSVKAPGVHLGPRRWVLLLLLSVGLPSWMARAAENADAPAAPSPVVLPFDLRRGHVMVPARLPGTNAAPLSLLLDTGYSM